MVKPLNRLAHVDNLLANVASNEICNKNLDLSDSDHSLGIVARAQDLQRNLD